MIKIKYQTLGDLRAGNSEEIMNFLNRTAIEALERMDSERKTKWMKIIMQEANENYVLARGGVSYDLLTAIIEDEMKVKLWKI